MKPDQCRAARALLSLTRPALSDLSKVNRNAIQLFESGRSKPTPRTLNKLRAAFYTLGVTFLDDDDGVGVRRNSTLDEIIDSGMYADSIRPRPFLQINPTDDIIAPEQSRAARAFLGLSQLEAARIAGVGLSLLVSFENGTRLPKPKNAGKIRACYEARGVIFLEINGQHAVQFSGRHQSLDGSLPSPSERP